MMLTTFAVAALIYNNNINMSSKIKFMNRGEVMASPVLHGWLNYH